MWGENRKVEKKNWTVKINMERKKNSPLGGLEPPTFRLTAERASQLRHRGLVEANSRNVYIQCQDKTRFTQWHSMKRYVRSKRKRNQKSKQMV